MRKSLLTLVLITLMGCNPPHIEESPMSKLIKNYRGPGHIVSLGHGFETLGYGFFFNSVKGENLSFFLSADSTKASIPYALKLGHLYANKGDTQVYFGVRRRAGYTVEVVVDSSSVFETDNSLP